MKFEQNKISRSFGSSKTISSWPNGSMRGLRLRGGMELDLSWKNGQLDEYPLHPGCTPAIIGYNGKPLRTVPPQ